MSCTEEYTIQNMRRTYVDTAPQARTQTHLGPALLAVNWLMLEVIGRWRRPSQSRIDTKGLHASLHRPDTSIQLLIADSCDSVPTNRAFARHTGVARHDNSPSRTAQTLAIPAPSDAQSDETSDAPVCNAPTCTRVHGLSSGAVGVARAKVDGACAVNSLQQTAEEQTRR